MNYYQSGISHMIGDIEHKCGVTLLERWKQYHNIEYELLLGDYIEINCKQGFYFFRKIKGGQKKQNLS